MIQVDRNTIIQIFGSLMQNPRLLDDTDRYKIETNQFQKTLDRYIFSAIYNLYSNGAEKIRVVDIDNYLRTNDTAQNLMESENGIEFLQDCETYAEKDNFPYYYNRFQKLNLLREMQKDGADVSAFYCEDPLSDDYDRINAAFEQLTTEDIIKKLQFKVDTYENRYVFNSVVEESTPNKGIRELLESLRTTPECGVHLQGEIFNTVVRGGRRGTLYVRSGSTGLGKTRSMVGDACEIAYPLRYEPEFGRWVSTGPCQKILYIMTEQNPDEIQTMILSYLTGFNEETFLYGHFTPEHEKIIEKALQIMDDYKDNFLQARIPEPTSAIVKNLFRRYNNQYGVDIFFFDYIFLTQAMVDEYKKQNLADHVCLRMFTTTLKNLAIELQAFVMTSTQVSEQDNDKKNSWKDYHNIAGARAIAHLVDVGCIMSRPTQEELQQLDSARQKFGVQPNVVCDVYKNRRGRWTMVRIWSYHNLGTCRKYDLFITDTQLRPIEDFQIVDFMIEKTPEEEEIESRYNEDNPVIIDDPTSIFTPQLEEVISYNIDTAFGTEQEQRQQVHNISFEDLV